jgi:ligand-binding sensor domain-containing protein
MKAGLLGGITQDPKGYMWFGTTGIGLFRYDGYQMINYKNDPANSNSLANNRVECIYADSADIIWLGTWGLHPEALAF